MQSRGPGTSTVRCALIRRVDVDRVDDGIVLVTALHLLGDHPSEHERGITAVPGSQVLDQRVEFGLVVGSRSQWHVGLAPAPQENRHCTAGIPGHAVSMASTARRYRLIRDVLSDSSQVQPLFGANDVSARATGMSSTALPVSSTRCFRRRRSRPPVVASPDPFPARWTVRVQAPSGTAARAGRPKCLRELCDAARRSWPRSSARHHNGLSP